MTEQKIIRIDGGSAEYWRDRKQAFGLIRDAELAAKRLAEAPMYLHGGYDEDGDVIPIENLGPHDDMEDAIWAIEALSMPCSAKTAAAPVRMPCCFSSKSLARVRAIGVPTVYGLRTLQRRWEESS